MPNRRAVADGVRGFQLPSWFAEEEDADDIKFLKEHGDHLIALFSPLLCWPLDPIERAAVIPHSDTVTDAVSIVQRGINMLHARVRV